jgi:magnesium-transporting ATPase (P-type)
MSVIVKTKNGIRLYCKGADNVMMARLNKSSNLNNPALIQKADTALTDFSNIGLRTLVVAYRDLEVIEYEEFKRNFEAAEISLTDRDELLAKASEMVENGLVLVGCTAIEDKLQDQVPETIENLLNADIKLWLLTGDKQETAINIGLSSRLINNSMKLLILNAADPTACEVEIDAMIVEQTSAGEVFISVCKFNTFVGPTIRAGRRWSCSESCFWWIG